MEYSENIENEFSSYFPSEISFSEGGLKGKINAFRRIFSSKEVSVKFRKLIKDFRPDIIHLNNIHSYLSPVLATIAKESNLRIVWTLHDYKLICPSYSCLKNKKTCELCFENKFNVLSEKCMKNSLVASMIAYLEAIYWNKSKLESSVDTFICPSAFMRSKMIEGGFSHLKLKTLHNFCNEMPSFNQKIRDNNFYLYVGRLSYEKGLETLLEVANKNKRKLFIAGTGPLEVELKLKYSAIDNIKFLGHLNKEKLNNYIKDSKFVVIPSEWYENNPLSGIESLLLGTPLLGANIGGIPELITKENGRLFESGDKKSLTKSIEEMFSIDFDNEKIANDAFSLYNRDRYYEELMKIYK